jgi:hypothetical protein
MQRFSTIVRGIVIPVKWDDDGNALSAVIMSTDEKVYSVEDDEKAKDLLNFLQQEITVTGSVRKSDKGSYLIKIADYISRNRFGG